MSCDQSPDGDYAACLQDFCDALKAALDKEQERRAAQRAATGRIDFTAGAKHT